MNIASKRLQSQRIVDQKFTTPEEVVRWMGAMQAQDYGQAVWAVGLRTKEPSLAAVEKAITSRKILLTWPMRGTIHFVPAEDAKWMVQALAARRVATDGYRQRQLGIDATMLKKVERLFISALKGGKCLTRPEIMQLLEDANISTQNQRGYHLIVYFAITGLICQGPLEGKKQTFTLLDEWVPHARQLTREQGLGEIAKRYFTSHGPATIPDFANWANLSLTDAKFGLEAAKASLAAKEFEGKQFWMSKEVAAHAKPATGLHLLPGFDEYMLGYKDRSAVLEAQHASKIVPGGNGVFKPTIVVDGQIVGIWRRVFKKSAVDMTFEAFSIPLPDTALAEAAKQYAEFIGLSLGQTTSI